MNKSTVATMLAGALLSGSQATSYYMQWQLAQAQQRATEMQQRASEDHYQYERSLHVAIDNGDYVKLPDDWK